MRLTKLEVATRKSVGRVADGGSAPPQQHRFPTQHEYDDRNPRHVFHYRFDDQGAPPSVELILSGKKRGASFFVLTNGVVQSLGPYRNPMLLDIDNHLVPVKSQRAT